MSVASYRVCAVRRDGNYSVSASQAFGVDSGLRIYPRTLFDFLFELPIEELRDIVSPTRWLVNPSIHVVAGVRTVTT
jgi:hypothetical protein